MFGSDKKSGAPRPAVQVDTLIGASTVIKGDISFTGGLNIAGRVFGAIVAENGGNALLVLSENGSIEGEVRAPHVVIHGAIKGDIVASEHIQLAAQARVTGNIYYKLLEMAAGAQVNGQIVREEEPRKSLPKPTGDTPAEPVATLNEAKAEKKRA